MFANSARNVAEHGVRRTKEGLRFLLYFLHNGTGEGAEMIMVKINVEYFSMLSTDSLLRLNCIINALLVKRREANIDFYEWCVKEAAKYLHKDLEII